MATDDEETSLVRRDRNVSPIVNTLEALYALRAVALAELCKGPSVASNAWKELADVIGRITGEDALGAATPVVGRQPAFMPRNMHRAPPAKGGATPTQPGQGVQPAPSSAPTAADIRSRADVAAELARVKTGGKAPAK